MTPTGHTQSQPTYAASPVGLVPHGLRTSQTVSLKRPCAAAPQNPTYLLVPLTPPASADHVISPLTATDAEHALSCTHPRALHVLCHDKFAETVRREDVASTQEH
jgi:hypothetical protein